MRIKNSLRYEKTPIPLLADVLYLLQRDLLSLCWRKLCSEHTSQYILVPVFTFIGATYSKVAQSLVNVKACPQTSTMFSSSARLLSELPSVHRLLAHTHMYSMTISHEVNYRRAEDSAASSGACFFGLVGTVALKKPGKKKGILVQMR